MSKQPGELPSHLSVKNAILANIDVARFTHIMERINDTVATVNFLEGYYSLCSSHITGCGGEVIKYMGDGCLAMFDASGSSEAIDAVCAIRDDFPDYCRSQNVTPTDIRAALHTGDVIVGGFGPEKIKDVLGSTANILFSMAGPGITISEQVYRSLDSGKRGPWRKHGGHVVYVMK